jgi:hypothetical protein
VAVFLLDNEQAISPESDSSALGGTGHQGDSGMIDNTLQCLRTLKKAIYSIGPEGLKARVKFVEITLKRYLYYDMRNCLLPAESDLGENDFNACIQIDGNEVVGQVMDDAEKDFNLYQAIVDQLGKENFHLWQKQRLNRHQMALF